MSNSPRHFSAVRFTERHGSASSTEGGRGRTNAYGRGCRELLNRNLTFFPMRGGSNSSTDVRRGRTTADGRGRRELLNVHFFTLESREGMRERLDTFAMVFFAFKSKRLSGLLDLLTFKFTNSSNTGALARAGV